MVMDLSLTLCKYDLRKGMTVWGSVGMFVVWRPLLKIVFF